MAVKYEVSLLFILTSAGLVCNVFSVCLGTTLMPTSVFQTDETTKVWCPNDPTRFYDAYCQPDGTWNHVGRETQCNIANIPIPIPSQVPVVPIDPSPIFPILPIFPNLPTGPLPVAPVGEGDCQFIESFMRPQDARGPHRHGSRVEMRCRNGQGSFTATCTNGAWLYSNDICTRQGIFGGLFNFPLFPTITSSPAVIQPGTDQMCAYVSNYMAREYAGKMFDNYEQQRFYCRGAGYEGIYFYAQCRNGRWYGDPNICRRQTQSSAENPFGNLFGGQVPWWIFLLGN